MMAIYRSAIVKQAQSWLGRKESDGSFKVIIDTYNSIVPLPRGYKLSYKDAWCAGFVSAVSKVCGALSIIPAECSCNRMITLFKNLGEWVENDAYVPKAGDVIFYDWDDSGSGDNKNEADHVGIVESCYGSTIVVIEGNYSDSVKRRELKVNGRYIRGFGVPKYDTEPTPAPTPTPSGNAIIKAGQQASIKFTGHAIEVDGIRGPETRRQAARVLQHAMNLDYRKKLAEDGVIGILSRAVLGVHYVKYGEKQYMVTAAEILLMMLGKDPKGVEYPGIFGSGLKAAAGKSKITASDCVSYTK